MGSLISDARRAEGLSQEDLARLIDMSLGSVRRYEQGRGMPDLGTITLLTKVMPASFSFDNAVEIYGEESRGKLPVLSPLQEVGTIDADIHREQVRVATAMLNQAVALIETLSRQMTFVAPFTRWTVEGQTLFAARLSRAVKLSNEPRREIARRAGIARADIDAYCSGSEVPDAETVRGLEVALDAPGHFMAALDPSIVLETDALNQSIQRLLAVNPGLLPRDQIDIASYIDQAQSRAAPLPDTSVQN